MRLGESQQNMAEHRERVCVCVHDLCRCWLVACTYILRTDRRCAVGYYPGAGWYPCSKVGSTVDRVCESCRDLRTWQDIKGRGGQ